MEVLKPTRPRIRGAGHRSGKRATAIGLAPPRRAQRLSWTFFERPAAIGQASDGPPDGGRGDCLPKLFLKSLSVLFQGKVVVFLQVLGQPLFEHHPFPGGPAGDSSWLHIPRLSTSL